MLNRVGSPRHEEVLRAAAAEVGLPVLGALPRRDALAVPSRHLGLVTAAEHGAAAMAAVDAMAELVAAHVDLDAVTALARPLPPGPAWSPDVVHDAADRGRARPTAGAALEAGAGAPAGRAAGAPPVRVAVFGGQAFTFGYAEHVELLAAAGAEVVVVDPLRDTRLPDGTAALVLPGGFPEEHVGALAANVGLRAAVRALAGVRRAGARRVRWPALPVRHPRRRADVRRPARRRDDDGPAHAGLPRRRGAHPVAAAPRGRPGDRARVPPLRRHPPRRRTRRGPGAAPSPRASSTAASTPRSCTPTRRGSPEAVARLVAAAAG